MENNSLWLIIRRMRAPFLVLTITFSVSILGLVLIPAEKMVDGVPTPHQLSFFDAFYFVSYMATTIGFGESPYDFTYGQKMWVSLSIYLTVVGWFYAIGTLVSLIQDKRLQKQLALSAFKSNVSKIKEDFIIVLGYNNVTKAIIDRLNYTRVVVIDKRSEVIEEIELENYHPIVPAIEGDATIPEIIKFAGIHSEHCKAVVSLFDDDAKNTKIALITKLLNRKVDLIIKSTTRQQTEHLKNIGIRNIENPFEITSRRMYLSIKAPHIWVIEMWLNGHILKIKRKKIMPKGRYIICGYGRMGHALEKGLKDAGVEYTLIDIHARDYKDKKKTTIFGDLEDVSLLERAGVEESDAIIAATNDDLINLTILSTARKVNPNIYTIARENTIHDSSIFKTAKIDKVYEIETILSHKTFNFIARPLANTFTNIITEKCDEDWGKRVFGRLVNEIGENPIVLEKTIAKEETNAVYNGLMAGDKITLDTLTRSREDQAKRNSIIFLLMKKDNRHLLLPELNTPLEIGDSILIACNFKSLDDLNYIFSNYYDYYYALDGRDKVYGLFKYMDERKRRKLAQNTPSSS